MSKGQNLSTLLELTFVSGPITAVSVASGPIAAGTVVAGPDIARPFIAGPDAAGPVAGGPKHQRAWIDGAEVVDKVHANHGPWRLHWAELSSRIVKII